MATLVDIGLTLIGGKKKENALIAAANAQRAANEYNYTLLGQKKESLKQASKLLRKFSARKDFSDLAKAEVAAFNATGQQSLQAQVENSFVVTNAALQKYRNDVSKDIDLQNAMYLTKLEGDARVEGLLNQADAAMFDAYREAAYQIGTRNIGSIIMPKIPLIQRDFNVDISKSRAYDPSAQIAAAKAEAQKAESMINVGKSFIDGYQKAEDISDAASYKKGLKKLALELNQTKVDTLTDPDNTLKYDEVWDAKLQPIVDQFDQEIGQLVSRRNSKKFKQQFSVDSFSFEAANKKDNANRQLQDFTTKIGGELTNAILVDDEELKTQLYSQLVNINGEQAASDFKSSATLSALGVKRKNLLQQRSLLQISQEDFEMQLKALDSEDLNSQDKLKNSTQTQDVLFQLDKQYFKSALEVNDYITTALADPEKDFAFSEFQGKIRYLPKGMRQQMKSTLVEMASQKAKYDKGSLLKGIKAYQAMIEGKDSPQDVLDTFAKGDAETQQLGLMLVSFGLEQAIIQGATTIKGYESLNTFDRSVDINGYGADFLQKTIAVATANPTKMKDILQAELKQLALFQKKNPNPTAEEYLAFRRERLFMFSSDAVFKSATKANTGTTKSDDEALLDAFLPEKD